MDAIRIGGRTLGEKDPPFIIAEMSGNHGGRLENALKIVDAAHAAGAHALKLQTYRPDTITLDRHENEFLIDDPQSLWYGKSLYQLYEEAQTPWEWHRPLFERCHQLGMTAFSSPFDPSAVDFLETLNVPCYKIASFENVDLPLIRKAASTRKPLFISTGMATMAEIGEAVDAARGAGCRELVLLKCNSSYPGVHEEMNLRTIPVLRERFGCWVGLSDHTLGIGAAVASVALGAVAIEKHMTLTRKEEGVDSAFSMEPSEWALLVRESERAWKALGHVQDGPTEHEKRQLRFRRSIYVVEDVRAGEALTERHIRSVRPDNGLPPKKWDTVLGKKAKKEIKKGTPLKEDLIQ